MQRGFCGSSAGKKSAWNAGVPGSIPGLGSSPGEGISYTFQYSWTSLMVQTVKNPPAMRETWVWSLGWEYPLEEGMATHPHVLAWRIPLVGYSPWGHKELDRTKQLNRHYCQALSLCFCFLLPFVLYSSLGLISICRLDAVWFMCCWIKPLGSLKFIQLNFSF